MATKKKTLSEMNVKELQAAAKKLKVQFNSKANKATLIALIEAVTAIASPASTSDVEEETTFAPEVTETVPLHQHTDANNFGAHHDESEARKLQKRSENGYTGN